MGVMTSVSSLTEHPQATGIYKVFFLKNSSYELSTKISKRSLQMKKIRIFVLGIAIFGLIVSNVSAEYFAAALQNAINAASASTGITPTITSTWREVRRQAELMAAMSNERLRRDYNNAWYIPQMIAVTGSSETGSPTVTEQRIVAFENIIRNALTNPNTVISSHLRGNAVDISFRNNDDAERFRLFLVQHFPNVTVRYTGNNRTALHLQLR